jgi:hypothetical protein
VNSEVNFVLELVDGTVLITALSAAIFILIYIFDSYRASGRSLINYLRNAPIGVRLAMPLLLVKVGAVLLVGALLSSRFRDQHITTLELSIVMFGIVMLVIALVWMTRVLTETFYGEWPWVTTTLATIFYIVTMMLWHFH